MSRGSDGHELITEQAALDRLIRLLLTVDRYALDTEFHRERTYWPRLALVQVAWPAGPHGPAGVALIDPLAVDVRPLTDVLASSAVLVAHAADQDLEVLDQLCGRLPGRLFDTQVAAGFLGFGTPSLASLAAQLLRIQLPKGDRLTDWSQRPLTDSQRTYAAADVAHLLDLTDVIVAQLSDGGRLTWAEEECEMVRLRAQSVSDPDRAWWKLRNARQLRGHARGVAQAVAAWRERRAREVDQPVRFVLPDLAIQAIAHGQPQTEQALRQIRGLDSRHLRGPAPGQLIEAIKQGAMLPEQSLQLPPVEDVARELRPAVALAAAWVAQLAREQRIDAAMLATRNDLVDFLRRDPEARLAQGWRARMVGEPLAKVVAGEAALAFDGEGNLVLEARSHKPVDLED